MNALEDEYEDSVRRAALANERRENRVWYVGIACVLGGYRAAATFLSGRVVLAAEAAGVTVVVAAFVYAATPVATRIAAGMRDRDVVDVTTAREKTTYRAAWSPEQAVRETAVGLRLGVVIAALLVVYVVLVDVLSGRSDYLVIDALIVGATAVGYAVKPVYEAWRKRRNARLELQSERWLASADTCEVRPRKWTK